MRTKILPALLYAALLSGCGGDDTAGTPADTTPDAFTFADQGNAATAAPMTSSTITITGIDAPATVTVTGGSYSIGCGATFTSGAGTLDNNDSVCVRHTSSSLAGTSVHTLLTVGGVSDTFTSTTAAAPGADTTPDAFGFTDQSDAATAVTVTSAPITITGIDSPATVTVTGGSYSIGCGATFTSGAGTMANNDSVCVRHTSSGQPGTSVHTLLTIGGVSDTFTSTTAPAPAPVADTTPDAFSFTDQEAAERGAVITSAAITISGIDAPASVTVAGGTYSIGCGATFTSGAGTMSNNDSVCVRHTASEDASASVNTTLTVGGVSDTFSSTTAAAEPVADTTPDAFSFTDVSGVTPGAETTSAAVTITGIDAPAAVTVAGGSYSIGCGATFTSSAGSMSNGDTVCVRHTASGDASTSVDTTLTVGGVSDTFRSTTAVAGPVSTWLPFLTGSGDLRLFDPDAPVGGGNPVTVDTGLAPPPTGTACHHCFAQDRMFVSGTVSGTTVSNLHTARLAYAKRAAASDAGGMVYRLDLTLDAASNLPVRISSLTDACAIVQTETTDFTAIDSSAVVVERAGPDLLCSTAADNAVTVIRLNSAAADDGVDLPLALEAFNPLHAWTLASGAVDGYFSFEHAGADTILLVRRDENLANPVTLATLGQATGASLERTDLTHLFVTGIPVEDSMKLFRVESDGNLSPVLYDFTGYNGGNSIQDGLHDATHLYFSDANLLLRIPLGSTAQNAEVIATLDPALRFIGNWALDASTTPSRVVFDAQDDSYTVLGGVFSAATNGAAVPATPLVNNPPPSGEGGYASLLVATQGRAYISVDNHGSPPEARTIDTDGAELVTLTSAYWAGRTRATAHDLALNAAPPTQALFLATREAGNDTLTQVDPATGATGAVLGTVIGAESFLAVHVAGWGTAALARAEIDRFGNIDNDVYVLDAESAGSLTPLAETGDANDIPLGE